MGTWQFPWARGFCVLTRGLRSGFEGLTLVTYDRRIILPLLKTWTEEAHSHAGMIFIDEKRSFPQTLAG
jgi:hypothetical protein